MSNRRSLPWPAWMLALDVVGTMLLAMGLLGLFGGMAPASMDPADVRGISIAVLVFGVVLMLPFVVTIFRQALESRKTG